MTERKTYLFEMTTETYTPGCVDCSHVERVEPSDGYAVAYRWTQPDLIFTGSKWNEFYNTYFPELKQLSWLVGENGGKLTITSDEHRRPVSERPVDIVGASSPCVPVKSTLTTVSHEVKEGSDIRPSMKRALANIEYITI